jgi:hypothetical protein
MIENRLFPFSSAEMVALLGPEGYNVEVAAVSRFCRGQREIDNLLFLLYKRAVRWDAGFSPQDTWDMRNLDRSEGVMLQILTRAFHPRAVQYVHPRKKWIHTLFQIQASTLIYPGIDGFVYHKKFRGTLAPAFSCLYRQGERGLESIFIFERIYKGSAGKKVYRAIDMNLWVEKAVTVWPASPATRREATLPAVLQTENCKSLQPPYETLFEVQKTKGGTKLIGVSEYCPSDCLLGSLSYKRQKEAVLAALEGAAYMLGRGWVHKDIKPDNILIARDRSFRLADYSLSCPLGELNAAGTDYYASPETFQKAPASEASTVWEIGITGLALLGYPIKDELFLGTKRNLAVTDETITERVSSWFRQKKFKNVDPVHWVLFDIYVSCLKANPPDRPSIVSLIDRITKVVI